MRSGFRPRDRDRTTESMEGSLLGFGPLWKGVLGCKEKGAYMVTRLTVGVPNDLQMARNLTGGLPVVYQGHLASLGPFRESLIPTHNRREKGNAGEHRSAELQNGQRGKGSDARDEHVCKMKCT